jgi:hypothetical protein
MTVSTKMNSDGRLTEPETLVVDPFSYFPGAASKIRGLGGNEERPELAYGFHSNYLDCGRGHCRFDVQFDALAATEGVIHLRVHMLADRPGSEARLATSERIYLKDLAEVGGKATVRFESLPGMIYAIFGQVLDVTDASADGLSVLLILERDSGALEDSAATQFGDAPVRNTALLTSTEEPLFATPVSQVYSPAQTREPAFKAWRSSVGTVDDPLSAWERSYILQVLHRYGMIGEGSRGASLSTVASGLEEVLAARGCLCVGYQADAELDGGQLRNAGPSDFQWTLNVLERLPGTAALQLVQSGLAGLRSGGLAVHVTRIVLDAPPQGRLPDGPRPLFRHEIERMVLALISQGHVVAQIRFMLGHGPRDGKADGMSAVPFGLIVRRA